MSRTLCQLSYPATTPGLFPTGQSRSREQGAGMSPEHYTLTISTETQVMGLVFEGTRCVGVEILRA